MTLSDFRHITDELLSAYIDDEVTEQERAWVEAAIAQDEEIAWRLDSLRQTVNLLHELPELALPRSFMLTLDQLAAGQEQMAGAQMRDSVAQELLAVPTAPPRQPRQIVPEPELGFWAQFVEGWRRFWQGGNPMLRNAAAVSFALLLFLTSGGQILTRALTQPVGMMATAPEAAPASASGESAASSEAAPAQAVAIAPTATEAASLLMQAAPAEEEAAEGDTSAKAPVVEGDTAEAESSDAPVAESARVMEAPAEAASDAPADEDNATAARVAEESSTENASDAAVAASAAAVAEAAPESAAANEAPAEPAIAAAMAAPEATQGDEMPPLVPNPLPGGGAGGRPQAGGGGMGGGPEGPIGGGAETNGLIPEQAYGFDVNPAEGEGEGLTPMPAAEAVAASVAAAPSAEEAAESSVADVAVTPAVEAIEAEAAEVESAQAEAESSLAVTASEAATAAPTAQAVAVAEATDQVTEEATPEAIALVAPGAITSSEVVEAVNLEGATPPTGLAGNLPVVWVAQGTAFLLTIVLASLWWRSRTPRRR